MAIAVVGLVIAVGYGAWYSVWQSNPAQYPAPPFVDSVSKDDLLEQKKVRSDILIETGSNFLYRLTRVDIVESTVEKESYYGPKVETLGIVTPGTFKGEIIVMTQKDGDLIDRWRKNVQVDEGWFDLTTTKTITDMPWLKLGPVDTGQYDLVAVLYNNEGEEVYRDEIKITI